MAIANEMVLNVAQESLWGFSDRWPFWRAWRQLVWVVCLLPVIFPMIPMTVSLFTVGQIARQQEFRNAFIYGLSIIAILFHCRGLAVAAIQGPESCELASDHNWAPNLFFSSGFSSSLPWLFKGSLRFRFFHLSNKV